MATTKFVGYVSYEQASIMGNLTVEFPIEAADQFYAGMPVTVTVAPGIDADVAQGTSG